MMKLKHYILLLLTLAALLFFSLRVFRAHEMPVSQTSAIRTVPLSENRLQTIVPATPEEAAAPAKPAADGMRPVGTWKNVGNATAATGFESLFWAKEHINNVVLASLIGITPEVRKKA